MSRLEADKDRIKSVSVKIKTFLHQQSWKEVLIFFLFLLLSFGFWVFQSMNEEYEIEISVPIRYKNIPADIAFTQTPPEAIVISVKDKGNTLMNYTFLRGLMPLEVDYNKKRNKNGVLIVSQQDIETHIQKQLSNTTLLHGFTPNRIEVKTSKRKAKKVPVKFNGVILPYTGYGLSEGISISPAVITIYSTQNILDSITDVKTTYMDLKNVKKDVSKNVLLEKIPGVSFEESSVALSIPIEEFTEKTLDIPVVCTGVPHNFVVRIFPPSVQVNCNTPLSKYKDLTEDKFSIRLKYDDLEQNLTGFMAVELEKKPDWIHVYSLVPNKIEFIIEQIPGSND
jgi:hypothetical protein